jgi:hypothetical protein
MMTQETGKRLKHDPSMIAVSKECQEPTRRIVNSQYAELQDKKLESSLRPQLENIFRIKNPGP